ncbi:MAG: protein kinase [Anaerolineae bacterium]|nr:protein kinase [Anaerolineae bacterium]
MDDLTGRVIRGYELHESIGVGGFGAIYRAYQPIVQREVAIKIILPEYASQTEFIHRFEAEAQVVARLEHMHIVPLYDYWRDPDGAYLVMRYLRGGSVQQSLAQHGAWVVKDTIRLLDQITTALAHAHRNGVIHRDLKPGNILLDEQGNAFLSDFGIAKDLRKSSEVLPEEGFWGSPAYLAPEQVLREPLSPQTDIYSLGIVLFELLTGQRPFDAPTETTVMRHHVNRALPPLSEVRPDLPTLLDIVVRRATSKQPADRYTNVLQLATEFRNVASFIAETTNSTVQIKAAPLDTQQLSPPKPETLILETVDLNQGKTQTTADLSTGSPVEVRNPYKGLRPFDEADANDFFGRDALINRLLGSLSSSRFLAVVGPSGSGKSSAVRAGLIPALRQGEIANSGEWFIATMTPGNLPLSNLQDALARVAVRLPDKLEEQLAQDSQGLQHVLEYILPEANNQLVLVIDQFEELFTLVNDETARAHFMDALATAVDTPQSRLRLVLTLRADFYDRPLLHAAFGDLVRQHTEVVLPLSPTELRKAITAPAEHEGLKLEPALVDTILDDVHEQPGALPLLQYALTELFNQREENTLTVQAYHDIGGVSGALARRADEIYDQLDSDGQNAARQLFLRLVTLGTTGEDTRRRVIQAELESLGGKVIQQTVSMFGQYRLLTFDRDLFTRAPTVEIAHEALIHQWGRLAQWLADSRAALQVQRRMAQEVNEWLSSERDAGFLATYSRLAQYETLLDESTIALTEDEQAYLRASITRRQQMEKRRQLSIAALIIFSVVALGLALLALDRESRAQIERTRADQEASVANSRELAVRALTSTEDQLDLALLLSVEALDVADTFEARNSLLTALETQPHLVSFLHGHSDAVRTVEFDPQGGKLASAGRDNSIILWDTDTHQAIGVPLVGHDDWINSLAFSPNGQILASAGEDSTIRLWDTQTGDSIGQPFTGHDGAVWSVHFIDNGQRLASAGEDSTIRLWDVQTGEPIGQPLTGHTDLVFSIDSHGDQLVSGSADGTIRLWNVQTGEPIGQPFAGHTDWVLSVAFSPDGQTIASGGADQTVRLWDSQTGDMLATLSDYADWVRSVAFSPDGRYLVSGSADGSIYLLDMQSGQNRILGHQNGAVWSTVFSSDGLHVASGGVDVEVMLWDVTGQESLNQVFAEQAEAVSSLALQGNLLASANGNPAGEGIDHSILIWDITTGEERWRLDGHQQAVTAIAFRPDGNQLASASADQTLILWDLETGNPITSSLTGHTDAVMTVAYGPDGQTIASGGFDNTIRLWDTQTGTPVGSPLTGHTDAVLSVAFSPDGQILASGGFDNTVRLWDTQTDDPIGSPLTGHTDVVTHITFNSDGTLLASTSRDGSVLLWDLTAAHPVGQPLMGHQNWVLTAAFNPTEPVLATGSRDQMIILWDLDHRQPLGNPLEAGTDWVSALVYSADGRTLFSGSYDKRVRQWQTGLSDWRSMACRIANRTLTEQEQQQYLRGIGSHNTCSQTALIPTPLATSG